MGESIVYGLKIAFAFVIIGLLFGAFGVMYSAVTSIDVAGVAGEVLNLIGVFLPFDGSVVFGTFASSITVIVVFLLAYKSFMFSKTAGELS